MKFKSEGDKAVCHYLLVMALTKKLSCLSVATQLQSDSFLSLDNEYTQNFFVQLQKYAKVGWVFTQETLVKITKDIAASLWWLLMCDRASGQKLVLPTLAKFSEISNQSIDMHIM